MRIIPSIQKRLDYLLPNPQCRILANDYDRIEWFDARPLPSAEEIEAIDPTTIITPMQKDISDNLPSWEHVSMAVDNIATLADAKAFLLKLARVVYWLAKNKKD